MMLPHDWPFEVPEPSRSFETKSISAAHCKAEDARWAARRAWAIARYREPAGPSSPPAAMTRPVRRAERTARTALRAATLVIPDRRQHEAPKTLAQEKVRAHHHHGGRLAKSPDTNSAGLCRGQVCSPGSSAARTTSEKGDGTM